MIKSLLKNSNFKIFIIHKTTHLFIIIFILLDFNTLLSQNIYNNKDSINNAPLDFKQFKEIDSQSIKFINVPALKMQNKINNTNNENFNIQCIDAIDNTYSETILVYK